MIDFEKICKEHKEDCSVISLHVNASRDYFNKTLLLCLSEVRDYFDLPFPETEQAFLNLGYAYGLLDMLLFVGYIIDEEYSLLLQQLNIIKDSHDVPEEIYNLKLW